ncbi:hypothetical protein ACGFR8_25990 [Streptomyces brevispora]|uniref:hypothetical protein n=1 Tax=Streptomyces brevispora TaxID=887462 RepID=UPI00371C1951
MLLAAGLAPRRTTRRPRPVRESTTLGSTTLGSTTLGSTTLGSTTLGSTTLGSITFIFTTLSSKAT